MLVKGAPDIFSRNPLTRKDLPITTQLISWQLMTWRSKEPGHQHTSTLYGILHVLHTNGFTGTKLLLLVAVDSRVKSFLFSNEPIMINLHCKTVIKSRAHNCHMSREGPLTGPAAGASCVSHHALMEDREAAACHVLPSCQASAVAWDAWSLPRWNPS